MAKGQQRSNREARKPKKEKSAAPKADAPTFGSKMANAANAAPPRGKGSKPS